MIPKDILKKIKPWMWLSTYIVLLLFALIHFQDLMGVLGKVLHLLTPLFYAIGIAFVLNQPMKAIEKGLIRLIQALPPSKKKPAQKEPKVRGISIFLTLLLALAVLFVLSSIIFPQLITSIVQLFNNCVVYAGNIVKNINNLLASLHLENIEWDLDTTKLQAALDQLGLSADKIFQTATNWVGGTGMTVINNISAITVGVSNWVMGFMLSLYLLSSKEKFIRQLKKLIGALLPLSAANRILALGRKTNQTFSSFISGQLLEACILAMLYYVSMTLFKMPYAMLISTVIGVTSIVPMFGAMLGMAFGCVLIFAINPWMSLFFMVYFQIVQQFENNLIYPRVVGNSVGLPGIWVLLSIVVFGGLLGLFGMLIAVPATAVLYTLLGEFVNGRMRKKGQILDESGLLSMDSTSNPEQESSSSNENQ